MSGRAGSGSHHWRNQRLTSVALLPLGLWFLIALLRQPSLDYAIVSAWFAKPLQAFLAALFGATLLWHSMLGVQVVLEDYVGGSLRRISIGLSRLAHAAAALALAYALFRLVTAGAG